MNYLDYVSILLYPQALGRGVSDTVISLDCLNILLYPQALGRVGRARCELSRQFHFIDKQLDAFLGQRYLSRLRCYGFSGQGSRFNDFLEILRELCFALAGYRFKFIREIPR